MSGTESGYTTDYLPPGFPHDIFIITILSILIERCITVLFWSYESNPLVVQLGIRNWILVTAVVTVVLWLGWYYLKLYEYKIFRVWYLLIGVFHTLAAAANLFVISL